jgi:hypothetical protein
MENIKENTQQSQEQEKRVQKSTKLEILRKAVAKIHSKKDLRKQGFVNPCQGMRQKCIFY